MSLEQQSTDMLLTIFSFLPCVERILFRRTNKFFNNFFLKQNLTKTLNFCQIEELISLDYKSNFECIPMEFPPKLLQYLQKDDKIIRKVVLRLEQLACLASFLEMYDRLKNLNDNDHSPERLDFLVYISPDYFKYCHTMIIPEYTQHSEDDLDLAGEMYFHLTPMKKWFKNVKQIENFVCGVSLGTKAKLLQLEYIFCAGTLSVCIEFLSQNKYKTVKDFYPKLQLIDCEMIKIQDYHPGNTLQNITINSCKDCIEWSESGYDLFDFINYYKERGINLNINHKAHKELADLYGKYCIDNYIWWDGYEGFDENDREYW